MKKIIVADRFSHYPERWHLSPALDTGDFVFFSGVTGALADGTANADPAQQFRDMFENLGEILTAAGLSFDDIVEMTSYHVDLRRHLAAFIEAKDRFIGSPYPAWSSIGTTELITEGVLAEVRVICRRGV